jgi:hypothetical protein
MNKASQVSSHRGPPANDDSSPPLWDDREQAGRYFQRRRADSSSEDSSFAGATTARSTTTPPYIGGGGPRQRGPRGPSTNLSSPPLQQEPTFKNFREYSNGDHQHMEGAVSRKIAPVVSTSIDTFSCLELVYEASTKQPPRWSPERPTTSSYHKQLKNARSAASEPTRNNATLEVAIQEQDATRPREPAVTTNNHQKKPPHLLFSKKPPEATIGSSPFSETPAWFPPSSKADAKSPGRHKTDSLPPRLPSRRSALLQKSESSARSFANSSTASYVTGDEDLLSMAGSDFSFLEAGYEDETSYAEDMASIATDPNVIAIGIPAGLSQRDQAKQKDQNLINEVIANDIAEKEHNLKMRGTERAIIERRLSSPCIMNVRSLAEAKRSARFSSFTNLAKPRRSFLETLDASMPQDHLAVDSPPVQPISSRSILSQDALQTNPPGRLRGRKSAILASSSSMGLHSLNRQQKIQAARASMTGDTTGIARMNHRPPKSHSISSCSPPTIPVRRNSGGSSTIYSHEEEVNDDWDAQTESAETANGAATVATFSSGIDLDDKTRNNIISRSSSLHIARRRSSMQGETPSSLKSLQRSVSFRGGEQGGKLQAAKAAVSDASVEEEHSRPSDDKNSARDSRRSLSGASTSSRRRRPSDEKAGFLSRDAGGEAAPGAHAVRRTSSREQEKSSKGSLSLAARGAEREEEESAPRVTEENGLPFGPVMTTDILQEEDQDNATDLEAQAGVPVVLPGAFAVRPISDHGDQLGQPSSGYDSGFEDDSVVSSEDNPQVDTTPPSQADPPEERPAFRPAVSSAPVEAELYQEADYAHAQIVDVAEYDEKVDTKRVRLIQAFLVFLCLAVGTGIAMAILYSGKGGDEDCKGDCIPTIRGWDQLGGLLTGPTDSDSIQYGYSVAMSGDGYRVVIGLPGLDGRDDEGISSQLGGVFVLGFNGTDWATNVELYGLEADSKAGTAVVISEDGKRVAFGAPGTSKEGGYVVVYQEESEGVWEMVGDILGGIALNGTSAFGTSLAFSSDGGILAVGDKYASIGEALPDVGTLRMYQLVSDAWVPLGQDLYGMGANELFGWSIALSDDGQRVAASALGADNLRGEVRIFDFVDDNWVQAAPSLSGELERENFGAAVALGNGGDVIAIGAIGYSNNGIGVGRVRTYKYDADAVVWRPMGEPIDGDAQFDRLGSAVALSAAGDTLAIGSPENDEFGTNAGFVKIMRYDGSSWVQVGSKLGRPDSEGGLFGSSIALSSDGKQLVGGAPELTYDGKLSKVGRAWVYERVDTDA